MKAFGSDAPGIMLVEPLNYLGFLQLEANARLVLTDSGGVQEEACILGVPCVTLRDNTERPETLDVGANVLAGTEPNKIVKDARRMLNKKGKWANPFGDGKARVRIVGILRKSIITPVEKTFDGGLRALTRTPALRMHKVKQVLRTASMERARQSNASDHRWPDEHHRQLPRQGRSRVSGVSRVLHSTGQRAHCRARRAQA